MSGKNSLFINDRPPGVWREIIDAKYNILIRAVKKHSPLWLLCG